MTPTPVPTKPVIIELAVHVHEDVDPNQAAAALFDLISAVPCPWPEPSDPPGIVSYDTWTVRDVSALRDRLIREVVLDKLGAQGDLTVDPDNPPPHMRGPVQRMRENAARLVDTRLIPVLTAGAA
jgi:hypothetical protein